MISLVGTGAGVLLLGLAISNNSAQQALGVLGAPALLVGPSLGHVYGEHHFATPGFWVRTGGLAVVVGGGALYLADNFNFCLDDGGACPSKNNAGLAIVGLGAAVMLGGAIWDVATAKPTAERYNHKARAAALRLAPTAIRTADHATVGGIGLGGTF